MDGLGVGLGLLYILVGLRLRHLVLRPLRVLGIRIHPRIVALEAIAIIGLLRPLLIIGLLGLHLGPRHSWPTPFLGFALPSIVPRHSWHLPIARAFPVDWMDG